MSGNNFDPTNIQENLIPQRKSYFAHSVLFMTTKDSVTIFPKSAGELLEGITFSPEHFERFIAMGQKKIEEMKNGGENS